SSAGAAGRVVGYGAASAGTALLPTDVLSDGTYYAAQVAGGCESVLRTAVTVTVTRTPAPTLTNTAQTFCEIEGATVADLNTAGAAGAVIWYGAASGGTALLPTDVLSDGTYYAAQVSGGCESVLRTAVTVTVTRTPAPTLTNTAQTFCEIEGATVADLNTAGAAGTVIWYGAASGGTALLPTDALVDGTYYAAQVAGGCESVLRTAITVIVTKTPAPTV